MKGKKGGKRRSRKEINDGKGKEMKRKQEEREGQENSRRKGKKR